jgi:hypothetical protein
MSLISMAKRMTLEVPGLAENYAKTLLGEAQGLIQDSQLWSFQIKESGWLTPGLLFPSGPGNSVGTVTVTPYSNLVVADATATTAWQAYVTSNARPLFTELQFRSPSYSLYNIIGFNGASGGGYGVGGYGVGGYGDGTSGFAALTLDRPWMEPGGVNQAYMIYQAYFPVPVSDFKRFLSARNTTDNSGVDYWSLSRKDLAIRDAQRTIFDDPLFFVPFETDQRPGSATLGNMLIELWPHPVSVLPFSFDYLRRGPQLVNPNDTVPYPFTEEMVLWQAKEAAYLFKAAQKGEDMDRGSGADWRFLAGGAVEKYKACLKTVKDKDRDLMPDLYFNRLINSYQLSEDGYSTETGQLNVGRF